MYTSDRCFYSLKIKSRKIIHVVSVCGNQSLIDIERNQYMPTPKKPFWHKGYLKLKAIKSQHIQKEFSTLPLYAWKLGINSPL